MSETARHTIVIETERTRVVGVRFTPAEYLAIEQRANRIKIKVGAYVRMLMLRDALLIL